MKIKLRLRNMNESCRDLFIFFYFVVNFVYQWMIDSCCRQLNLSIKYLFRVFNFFSNCFFFISSLILFVKRLKCWFDLTFSLSSFNKDFILSILLFDFCWLLNFFFIVSKCRYFCIWFFLLCRRILILTNLSHFSNRSNLFKFSNQKNLRLLRHLIEAMSILLQSIRTHR